LILSANSSFDFVREFTNPIFRKSINMILSRRNTAPSFELFATPAKKLRLSELRGKRVILAFYPADWSPVCGDQMGFYNETLHLFRKYNAQLIGISVDSKWCHMAFVENRLLEFPLLADFEPKGAVSKLYGAYNEESGESERALFVIDEEGIIQWSYHSPVAINPGADGILDALEAL
jgi:peroxiredoxin